MNPVRSSRVLVTLQVLGGCATNPVTGAREFVMLSEAQEIAVILCTGVGAAHPSSFDIWAACLAELGDFEGAVDKAQQALILFDETPGDTQQRLAMEQRLAGYLEKKPHRISD